MASNKKKKNKAGLQTPSGVGSIRRLEGSSRTPKRHKKSLDKIAQLAA
jgi:hypothetical protein